MKKLFFFLTLALPFLVGAQPALTMPFTFNPGVGTVTGFSNPWGLVAGANVTLTVGAIAAATGESPGEVIDAFKQLMKDGSTATAQVGQMYWAKGLISYYKSTGQLEKAVATARDWYAYLNQRGFNCATLLTELVTLATGAGRTWQQAALDVDILASLKFNVVHETTMPDPFKDPCGAARWMQEVLGKMKNKVPNPNGHQTQILIWANNLLSYANLACRGRRRN